MIDIRFARHGGKMEASVKEIKALTGVRGVAATLVMLGHFLPTAPKLAGSLPTIIERSYLGVDLFFVLSGFVLAMNYGERFAEGTVASEYKLFLIKRLARIYPLYFVITIVFSIKYLVNFSGDIPRIYGVADFVACLLMVQTWGAGFTNVTGQTWSLSTEFFAYLVFPAYCFFLRSPRAALMCVPIFALLIFLVASSRLGVLGSLDVVEPTSLLPLVRCLAGFGLGVAAHTTVKNVQPSKATVSLLLTALVLIIVVLFWMKAPDPIIFLTLPLLVCLLYFGSGAGEIAFGNPIVHRLGVISYSIYLVHPLFRPAIKRADLIFGGIVGPALSLEVAVIVCVIGTFVCSEMLYRLVEVPGRLLLSRRTGTARIERSDLLPQKPTQPD